MTSFLEQYWEMQRDAETKYHNVVVLIEKGSFMECYSTDTFGHAGVVAKALNMIITRCNKNIPVSDTNPYMVGFPKVAHEKNVPVMIANGITIVWVEQVWDNFRKVVLRREVTRVITPGTYSENPPSDDGYFVGCVHTVASTMHCVAVMDTSTGSMETLSLDRDEDLVWFMEVYNPREILSINGSPIMKQLCKKRVLYEKTQTPFCDTLYQQNLLDKVFFSSSSHDIELKMRTAVVCLLDFVQTCHPKALQNIQYPKENWSNRLSLHNNAVSQLDLVASDNGIGVYGTLNLTRTAMGRRLLKRQMLHPMIDPRDMNNMYDQIDEMIRTDWRVNSIGTILGKIPDIDRLIRQIEFGTSTLAQICGLHASVRESLNLWEVVRTEFSEMVASWDKVMNCDELTFRKGYDETLDELSRKVCETQAIMDKVTLRFSSYGCKVENHPDRGGYHLIVTNKKGDLVKKQYPAVTTHRVNATTVRLCGDQIDDAFSNYTLAVNNERDRFNTLLVQWTGVLRDTYGQTIRDLSASIAELDCVYSKAVCAKKFGFVRPSVVSDVQGSYVQATNLKHPLIDNGVGNPCTLGTGDTGGVLLYGLNGAGKSCYAKSIAINVILAQAGFFVAASTFVFKPFTKIFTRIRCDDNLYRGMSSFTVEMFELRSILRLADKHSLVIGDELCKGTEDLSAVSLVASSIRWMSDHDVKYVFATHLHKLPTIDFVRTIPNLRVKHLTSEFNAKLGKIVFLRSIGDGQGDPLYGIEIARQILGVPEIANMAMMARKQLVEGSVSSGNVKKSRYNKRLLVQECTNCGETNHLHTHHIDPQVNYEATETKKMNALTNLVVLCDKCHDDIHGGRLSMETVHTINGVEYVFS